MWIEESDNQTGATVVLQKETIDFNESEVEEDVSTHMLKTDSSRPLKLV